MKRVIVFIDGLSIRFRLRTNGWTEYCDVGYLAKKLAGPRQLVHAGFYHPQPNREQLGPAQYAIDRSYLESVRKDSVTIVPEGAYMAKREKWVDGKKAEVWVEQQTDVLLASDLVYMAAKNMMDVAVLATADGDIIPAVRRCTELGVPVELLRFRGLHQPWLVGLEKVVAGFHRARPAYFQPYPSN